MELLTFLTDYFKLVAIVSLSATAIAVFVNATADDYYQTRRLFSKGKAMLRKCTQTTFSQAAFLDTIPAEYREQWFCFTESKGLYASSVLEFAYLPQSTQGVLIYVVAILLSAAYGVIYGFFAQEIEYLLFCLGTLLLLGIGFKLGSSAKNAKLKKAQNAYAHWTNALDGFFGKRHSLTDERNCASDDEVDGVLEQINILRSMAHGDVAAKIAELLRDKGLYKERTVEQQRRLNSALNDLMLKLAQRNGENP